MHNLNHGKSIISTDLGKKIVALAPKLSKADSAGQLIKMLEQESGVSLKSAILRVRTKYVGRTRYQCFDFNQIFLLTKSYVST
jgi:hypothetical protein